MRAKSELREADELIYPQPEPEPKKSLYGNVNVGIEEFKNKPANIIKGTDEEEEEIRKSRIKEREKNVLIRKEKNRQFSLLINQYEDLLTKKEYKTFIERLLKDEILNSLVLKDKIFRDEIVKCFLKNDNDFNDLLEVFFEEIDSNDYISEVKIKEKKAENKERYIKIDMYNNLFGLLLSIGKEKNNIESFVLNFNSLNSDLLKSKVLYSILEMKKKDEYDEPIGEENIYTKDGKIDIEKVINNIDEEYLEFCFGRKGSKSLKKLCSENLIYFH